MKLKLVTEKDKISNCERKMRKIVKDNCSKVIKGKFSYRSVSENRKNFDMFFFEKQKFWVSFPIYSEQDVVYCNYFGIENPIPNKQNSIIKELNVPKSGISRNLSGVFAYDLDGKEYLIDRGMIGGGAPGVGKTSFFKHFRGEKITLAEDNITTEAALVGCLDFNNFIDNLHLHLQEVERIKTTIKRPKIEIKESFQAIYTKEPTGEREFKGPDVIKANYEHGNIVDELRLVLENKGFKVGNNRRDLFIVENKEVKKIFEVKTDKTTSSVQKGIGQLILYSINLPKKPDLYLLLPDSLDKTTQKQLKQQVGIEIMLFEKKNETIIFPDLDNIVKTW